MNASSAPKISDQIAYQGFAFVKADDMKRALSLCGPLSDWDSFAASWGNLETDTYMADGGRYRRRRHAVYNVAADGTVARQPHQPHYQSLDFNDLNGGIDRWFAPVEPDIGGSASMHTVLELCRSCFAKLAPDTKAWKVEVHQFRIEAKPGESGKPTPEGMHRDGVDYVLVLLVRRHNVVSGTTTIADLDKTPLGSFTLSDAFDAALVDDARAYHGVTPIEPQDPDVPAFRDVLVVTFRRAKD
jgi:hypothetical protein